MALDLEGGVLSLLVPHGGGEVLSRVDDLVVSLVDVETGLLHLYSKFTHHHGGLGLVLVSLDTSFKLVWVIVLSLVGLCEGVMEGDSRSVVPEATEVWLWSLLLLYCDCDDFDLE